MSANAGSVMHSQSSKNSEWNTIKPQQITQEDKSLCMGLIVRAHKLTLCIFSHLGIYEILGNFVQVTRCAKLSKSHLVKCDKSTSHKLKYKYSLTQDEETSLEQISRQKNSGTNWVSTLVLYIAHILLSVEL